MSSSRCIVSYRHSSQTLTRRRNRWVCIGPCISRVMSQHNFECRFVDRNTLSGYIDSNASSSSSCASDLTRFLVDGKHASFYVFHASALSFNLSIRSFFSFSSRILPTQQPPLLPFLFTHFFSCNLACFCFLRFRLQDESFHSNFVNTPSRRDRK